MALIADIEFRLTWPLLSLSAIFMDIRIKFVSVSARGIHPLGVSSSLDLPFVVIVFVRKSPRGRKTLGTCQKYFPSNLEYRLLSLALLFYCCASDFGVV